MTKIRTRAEKFQYKRISDTEYENSNHTISVLAIPALLTSCLFDEEDLFDKSASERIEAAKQEAKTVLESAENGWHVRYFPSRPRSSADTTCFFKFSEGSVTVASEIESNPSTTETSLYSFGEDLGVTLNFDTKNSLINYFVQSENPDNIGSTYKGMEGDYKFTVMETSAAVVHQRHHHRRNYRTFSADTDWSEDLETYRNNAEDMSFQHLFLRRERQDVFGNAHEPSLCGQDRQ